MLNFFRPSQEDLNPKKKARFRQDMIAFGIMFLGGLAAIIIGMIG